MQEKIGNGKKIAILGVGSELRADDAAGMYLIALLSSSLQDEPVLLIGGSTAPENFTGVIKDYSPDVLLIVDAAHMDATPGEIRILDTKNIGGLSFSTHMLPLPVMLNYLHMEVGCEIVCIGIQPHSIELGYDMCEEVKSGIEKLSDMITLILQRK
jgi:hydrogenase 3 maturation protease